MQNEIKTVMSVLKEKLDEDNIIDLAIGSLLLDPISIKNLGKEIATFPMQVRDAIYWNKFYMFIAGVQNIQTDLQSGVSLSEKLLENEDNQKTNCIRLLGYIDKVDSEDKMQYMISGTRSFLLGLISCEDYFRIIKAMVDTLSEDLSYLQQNATNMGTIKGNIQVLALARSGLMIEAGIDGNVDVEAQEYAVTKLGRLVDQYALSFENEQRQKWYKEVVMEKNELRLDIPTASNEEIMELFNDKDK
jgi:hypothetical protein